MKKIIFDESRLVVTLMDSTGPSFEKYKTFPYIFDVPDDTTNPAFYGVIDDKLVYFPKEKNTIWWVDIEDWNIVYAVPEFYWPIMPDGWVVITGGFKNLLSNYKNENLIGYKKRIVKRLQNKLSEYYRLSIDNYTCMIMREKLMGRLTEEKMVKYRARVAVSDKILDKFKEIENYIRISHSAEEVEKFAQLFIEEVEFFKTAPYGLDGDILKEY